MISVKANHKSNFNPMSNRSSNRRPPWLPAQSTILSSTSRISQLQNQRRRKRMKRMCSRRTATSSQLISPRQQFRTVRPSRLLTPQTLKTRNKRRALKRRRREGERTRGKIKTIRKIVMMKKALTRRKIPVAFRRNHNWSWRTAISSLSIWRWSSKNLLRVLRRMSCRVDIVLVN